MALKIVDYDNRVPVKETCHISQVPCLALAEAIVALHFSETSPTLI
jgi:hypothetical protein